MHPYYIYKIKSDKSLLILNLVFAETHTHTHAQTNTCTHTMIQVIIMLFFPNGNNYKKEDVYTKRQASSSRYLDVMIYTLLYDN